MGQQSCISNMLLSRPCWDPYSIQSSIRAEPGWKAAQPSMVHSWTWCASPVKGARSGAGWARLSLEYGEVWLNWNDEKQYRGHRVKHWALWVRAIVSKFSSWVILQIKFWKFNMKNMSKYEQCVFSCGPRVVAWAQGWEQNATMGNHLSSVFPGRRCSEHEPGHFTSQCKSQESRGGCGEG